MKRMNRVRSEDGNNRTATEEELQAALGEFVLADVGGDSAGLVDFVPEEIDNDDGSPIAKKKKYSFVDSLDHPDDDLPFQYRHIRSGPSKVKPEYYVAKSILQSEYHMSDKQSDGAIMVVATPVWETKVWGMD